MKLFSSAQIEQINKVAAKSNQALIHKSKPMPKNMNSELDAISKKVIEYFKDSEAILITSVEQLHEYVDNVIQSGYYGIDTETTGLDRINDHIVGASLYYPGGIECYIPMKHMIPIFDEPYKNQLSYQEVQSEFQRLVDSNAKAIFANADFDLAMIYKDLKVDFNDVCYYDVILAWRCLKENELHNGLKELYNKYVLKGKGDPMKFNDFFSPTLFPYCKPEVAKLYAANDAKITYELFKWQLPFVTKSHPKCQKAHLEHIADLIWNVEIPLIKVCQNMHRQGVYVDNNVVRKLDKRYDDIYNKEVAKLQSMVDEIIESTKLTSNSSKRPFLTGKQFNPNSPPQVKYLLYNMLNINSGKSGQSTSKEILGELNLPVTNQILKVRSLGVLINTFVKKLPKVVTSDNRIHCQFKQIGAGCIVGNTFIPTSNGWLQIGEFCENNHVKESDHTDIINLSICNKDQKLESISSIVKYSNYPVIEIITECGFHLTGTYNHPIIVSKYVASDNVRKGDERLSHFWDNRYFKKLEDIELGDWVEIPCEFDISPKEYVKTNFTLHPEYQSAKCEAIIPDVFNEDFAEFLGMYHADGSANFRDGTYTITISNVSIDVRNRVDELSMKLFNVITSHYSAQEMNKEYDTYINCMQIKDIDSILSHGKQNKKIPSAIFKSPSSVISAYIRGMTLDSSVYIDENGRAAFELSIINESDADFIQQYLCSQGILCHKSFNENKGGWKSPKLCFNADNYILFRDNIGFIQSSKYINTKPNFKNSIEYRRINNSFRLKVKSIKYSKADVYDFHVPETHSFISGGFISHNTGRMSSADPNMQNIPSHATDIRHMFRASAASKDIVDCTVDNKSTDIIRVDLFRWNKVYTPDGLKTVNDLKSGDKISVKHNKEESFKLINSISDSTSDPSICNIVLSIDE